MMLLFSLIPLWCGPLLFSKLEKNSRWISFLDGFVFVSLIGMIFFSILPESFKDSHAWSLLAFAVGIWLPMLLENVFKFKETATHLASFVMVGFGLFLHTLMDGSMLIHVLDMNKHHDSEMLGLAVVLHRVPLGFGLWWLVRPHFGTRLVLWLLAWMTAGTFMGYLGYLELEEIISPTLNQAFQALVAGSLLHIIFHNTFQHSHGDHCHHDHQVAQFHPMESVGNALGVLVLIAAVMGHDIIHEHQIGEDNHLGMGTMVYVLLGWTAPLVYFSFIAFKKLFRGETTSFRRQLSRFSAFHLFLIVLVTWVVGIFGEQAHGFHEFIEVLHHLPMWGDWMACLSGMLTLVYAYFVLVKGARQYLRQFF